MTVQARIESEVLSRASHSTKDEVSDTRSYANMERALRREYHGRFVIELIQNARDAFASGADDDSKGVLQLTISEGPALLVCNQGPALSPDALLYSISKFGESTKSQGEGIGYKGIGFKSVLEVSLTPQIFSRADANAQEFALQVSFDPENALRKVRDSSRHWDDFIEELSDTVATGDGSALAHLPVLRFPLWTDEVPEDVRRASASHDGTRFNTVVRLPYDPRFSDDLGLDEETWVDVVRGAVHDVTDEILVLLDAFERVVIEDDIKGTRQIVSLRTTDRWEATANITGRVVSVHRGATESSRWILYRSKSDVDERALEGDRALALRVEASSGELRPVAPARRKDGPTDGVFHLFFPTRIRTHLPFLLHAYFEVDAGRRSFADDALETNRRLLDDLRSLAADAVTDLIERAPALKLDTTPLPRLFAETSGAPEDSLSSEFREGLLDELDRVRWVRTRGEGDAVSHVRPGDVLVHPDEDITRGLADAFPHEYVRERIGRHYPDVDGSVGLGFLSDRIAGPDGDIDAILMEHLASLLRPGDTPIWNTDDLDGFRSLVALLDRVRRLPQFDEIVNDLDGDEEAQIIPVVGPAGHHKYTFPRLPTVGERGSMILARTGGQIDEGPAPPDELEVAFLPTNALTREQLEGPARRLGIRPFETDTVLDRVAGLSGDELGDPDVLSFVWRLLLRESDTRHSIHRAVEEARTFASPKFVWCQPSAARLEQDRAVQRRRRGLASLLLPTTDGVERRAFSLVFGAAWADWFRESKASSSPVGAERARAYEDLEACAPASSIVAAPDELLERLPLERGDADWLLKGEAPPLAVGTPDTENDWSREHWIALLHAFLLRLGVSEYPPIAAFADYGQRAEGDRDPWENEPWRRAHIAHVKDEGGWDFNRSYTHKNVHVAQDYRFLWPLDAEPAEAMASAMSRGVPAYRQFGRQVLFCPQCGGRRHSSRDLNDEAFSISGLLWQLREQEWLPVAGDGGTDRLAARCVWIDTRGKGEATHHTQFMPTPIDEISRPLAKLAGIRSVADADARRLATLLRELRRDYADDESRVLLEDRNRLRAFNYLHRSIYRRLADLEDGEGTAKDVLDDVGVLCTSANRLHYRHPDDSRYDNGKFSEHLRYFRSEVPLVELARTDEDQARATRLGILDFELRFSVEASDPVDVSERMWQELDEYLPELAVLLVHHRAGRVTMDVGSEQFTERTRRLLNTTFQQVDSLVVQASVVGMEVTKQVEPTGEGSVHVDGPRSPRPTIVFDMHGSQWPRTLRTNLATHLAAILDSVPHADVFELLLRLDDEPDRERFLSDRGITPEDVDRVRDELHLARVNVRREEVVWWTAMCSVLGVPAPDIDDESYRDALEAFLRGSDLDADAVTQLLAAGGGRTVRSDDSPGGPLATLEANGVDLRDLHERLRAEGDRGLRLTASKNRFNTWLGNHGPDLAAILHLRGARNAKQRVADLQVPAELEFRIHVDPGDLLLPVIRELERVGVAVTAEHLTDDNPRVQLLAAAAASSEEAAEAKGYLYTPAERKERNREALRRWTTELLPLFVAALVDVHAPASVVNDTKSGIEGALRNVDETHEFLDEIERLLGEHPLVTSAKAVLQGPGTGWPSQDAIQALRSAVDQAKLDRVTTILDRRVAKQLDDLDDRLRQVDAAGVDLSAFAGQPPFTDRTPDPGGGGGGSGHVDRDQKRDKQLGRIAEDWVVATVVRTLTRTGRAELPESLERMKRALRKAFAERVDQVALDELLGHGQQAIDHADDPDLLAYHLSSFVHLSQVTDAFGCDAFGLLDPGDEAGARVMFLEVKATAGPQFHASEHQWETATRLRGKYAFVTAERDANGNPRNLSLHVDPCDLVDSGRLIRQPTDWMVTFRD